MLRLCLETRVGCLLLFVMTNGRGGGDTSAPIPGICSPVSSILGFAFWRLGGLVWIGVKKALSPVCEMEMKGNGKVVFGSWLLVPEKGILLMEVLRRGGNVTALHCERNSVKFGNVLWSFCNLPFLKLSCSSISSRLKNLGYKWRGVGQHSKRLWESDDASNASNGANDFTIPDRRYEEREKERYASLLACGERVAVMSLFARHVLKGSKVHSGVLVERIQ